MSGNLRPEEPTARVRTDDNEPSPRAFAGSTGVVFQAIGGGMFFVACCLWGISGIVVQPSPAPAETWLEYLRGPQSMSAAFTLVMMASVVGGLALAAAGIGLHGERPESGRVAMAMSAILAILYFIAAVYLFMNDGWGFATMAGVAGLVCVALFLLAAHSAAVLRKFPPPPDRGKVTEAFLEDYRRQREERRQKFDL